ncbi:hypothetical protein BACCOPRO_00173 [Phocaeicola coprophilus DSM 18228 = JCM 13818]|uniref:Uncharacterized protein n=1 Tax=Phocaeicola coprophilus DSM 18228 = JCM 13818 TaxID=547042 RepID=S0F4K5_9BACT|nr:hypothetical protein BACCOPRO_00173 [Phocaeicola coprophilus DSM 18228 = JCM 13818]
MIAYKLKNSRPNFWTAIFVSSSIDPEANHAIDQSGRSSLFYSL